MLVINKYIVRIENKDNKREYFNVDCFGDCILDAIKEAENFWTWGIEEWEIVSVSKA